MSSRLRGAGQRFVVLSLAGVACTLVVLVAATPAFSAASPWWRLSSRPAPTYLPPEGKEQKIFAYFTNLGDQSTSGEVTVKDTLPPKVEATSASVRTENTRVCEEPELLPGTKKLSCELPEPVLPYERIQYQITVKLLPGAKTGEVNTISVSGGGAPEKTLTQPIRVSSEPVPFGLEKAQLTPEEEGGAPDERAGSHPFQLTTTLDFNQILEEFPLVRPGLHFPASPALLRDLGVKLPPGLIGNVNAVPQCSGRDFSTLITFGSKNNINACPADTAVGTAVVSLSEPANLPGSSTTAPVFNLAPAPGEPARFGFVGLKVPVILKTSVQTGGNYSVVVSTTNTTELASVLSTEVTIWGEPGDPAHDNSRGWVCIGGGHFVGHSEPCTPPGERPQAPFLRLPTSCETLGMTAEGRSWPRQRAPEGLPLGQPQPLEGESIFEDNLGGCEGLPFASKFKVTPDTQAANTPTGLTVDVEVPQKESLQLGGTADADVKSTTVALPEGVLASPAAADGLFSCSEVEVGFLGKLGGVNQFTPNPVACHPGAKVATVQIESPFLPPERDREGKIVLKEGHPVLEKVTGALYLATQNENPFGSLLALYLVGETPVSHVRVKLPGEIQLNSQTGQIVSTFRNTPQLPFEHLQVNFFRGPRASVTTPPLCGTYAATSSFEFWNGKQELPEPSSFAITSEPGGAPCSNPQPFAPSFSAGTTNNKAAAFTPFSVTIGRPDSSQALTGITLRLPTGIAGILKNVPLCPEPQATQGTCSATSLIGHATSSSGLGSDPFTLTGQVYLTGPYNGAPFGITIVTPANAGPINASNGLPTFHLGNVIVRSGIFVDRYTAAVTIKTAVPTFVETAQVGRPGIPVQLKQTNVVVDRPNFQFNTTNCSPLKIEATLTGVQGGVANLASPYQATNCAQLAFKPTFAASTQAKTSKLNGASLIVKVTSQGLGVANIAKTKVALPIALPSRLTTIQKACIDKVFEANPLSCPEGSNIGTAIIRTPVFANPLKGPAFLVSHGNAAFPDVEFVLQGEGLTIILDGKTDIKKGITTSAFEALPDAPFTSFETVLPEGPHSALAAFGDLCAQREKLIMPTTITSQTGVVVKQNTKIAVTGCPPKHKVTPLQRALKACKKKHAHKKRVACERAARKKYGKKRGKK